MSAWTPERIETLKKLWADGLSCGKIAKVFGAASGISRNAVIGKVNRMGLAGRDKYMNKGKPKSATPRIPRMPKSATPRQPRKPKTFKDKFAAPIFEHVEEARLSDGEFATVLTITQGMCKWPIGDPQSENFHFCGNATPYEKLPYCAAHNRMSHQPGTALRDLKRPPHSSAHPPKVIDYEA